jgi:flagellar protein FlaI
MKFALKKPTKKVNLYKVFHKAVRGYRNLQKKALIPVPISPVLPASMIGFPVQMGPQMGPQIGAGWGPPTKIEKMEVEKIEKKKESDIIEKATPMAIKEPDVNLKAINIVYTLIQSESGVPFASANIKWNRMENSLFYYLIEPVLSNSEKELLKRIKTTIMEKLDIDFTTLRKGEARTYLRKRFEETINLMATELPAEKRKQFLYFVQRDFVGLDKIEPLMQDPNIEDISCDGVGIPIFVFHRNPLIGSIKTNIKFEDKEELDTFVSKVAQRCGKNISIAVPLIGGSLPDGSRVQATLGTDIARRGSNFTIRKFTRRPMTPTQLIKFKTIDPKIAAFLWLAVEYGRSILLSGGVASGKTTLLNALSLFIRPELKVVSIEDTAELTLPHPHWVPGVARTAITQVEGKKIGEVDLFDLLRESLRQRPDYLIVGEVRGREAYVLFQQIATGHSSMSTIHADSMERLVDRLTTPPIALPATLIEALDIVIFIVKMKYGQTYVRRIKSIYEVTGFDRDKNVPTVNEVYRWNSLSDKFDQINPSTVLEKITEQYGVPKEKLKVEIQNRIRVIEWMLENKIEDYIDVAKIIKLYYVRAEDLLDAIG